MHSLKMEAYKISRKISQNCKSQYYLTKVDISKPVREVLIQDLKLKRRKLDKHHNLKKCFSKGEVICDQLETSRGKWDEFLVKYTPYFLTFKNKLLLMQSFLSNYLCSSICSFMYWQFTTQYFPHFHSIGSSAESLVVYTNHLLNH